MRGGEARAERNSRSGGRLSYPTVWWSGGCAVTEFVVERIISLKTPPRASRVHISSCHQDLARNSFELCPTNTATYKFVNKFYVAVACKSLIYFATPFSCTTSTFYKAKKIKAYISAILLIYERDLANIIMEGVKQPSHFALTYSSSTKRS